MSELGTTITLLGTPNLRAALFVSLGMLISGKLLFGTGHYYMSHPTFMNNKFHTLHSLGSAMKIGPIFILEMIMLWERKPILGLLKLNTIIILLSISVLTYAVAFFSDTDFKQVSQKFCVINLLLVLVEGSHYLATISEPLLSQHQV